MQTFDTGFLFRERRSHLKILLDLAFQELLQRLDYRLPTTNDRTVVVGFDITSDGSRVERRLRRVHERRRCSRRSRSTRPIRFRQRRQLAADPRRN